jgi:hypothetical protein
MMRKMQAASFAELVKMAASLGPALPRHIGVSGERARSVTPRSFDAMIASKRGCIPGTAAASES